MAAINDMLKRVLSGVLDTTLKIPVASSANATTLTTEVVSSVKTATGSSGTITPASGGTLSAVVTVSAASGTSPTLDIYLEESFDGGATFTTVYCLDRLTTTGTLKLPPMNSFGVRRWSWTIGGTSPSFTFKIETTADTANAGVRRRLTDRTANVLNGTLGTATAALSTAGCTSVTAYVSLVSAGAYATFQLQTSSDGAYFANVGTATTVTTNTTIAIQAPAGLVSNWARVIVTSAGTTQVGNVVSIIGFG